MHLTGQNLEPPQGLSYNGVKKGTVPTRQEVCTGKERKNGNGDFYFIGSDGSGAWHLDADKAKGKGCLDEKSTDCERIAVGHDRIASSVTRWK